MPKPGLFGRRHGGASLDHATHHSSRGRRILIQRRKRCLCVLVQRRRRCILQPRVAAMRLPWGPLPERHNNPNGVVALFASNRSHVWAATPLGLETSRSPTQDSAFGTPLGFMLKPLRGWNQPQRASYLFRCDSWYTTAEFLVALRDKAATIFWNERHASSDSNQSACRTHRLLRNTTPCLRLDDCDACRRGNCTSGNS